MLPKGEVIMSVAETNPLMDGLTQYERDWSRQAFVSFTVKAVIAAISAALLVGGALTYALLAVSRVPFANENLWIYGGAGVLALINIYFLVNGIKGIIEARLSKLETQIVGDQLKYYEANAKRNPA
jgi:hypothetical protein